MKEYKEEDYKIQPIESKVEVTRFTQTCQSCGRAIKGTSRKQLEHTFDMHLRYCKREGIK